MVDNILRQQVHIHAGGGVILLIESERPCQGPWWPLPPNHSFLPFALSNSFLNFINFLYNVILISFLFYLSLCVCPNEKNLIPYPLTYQGYFGKPFFSILLFIFVKDWSHKVFWKYIFPTFFNVAKFSIYFYLYLKHISILILIKGWISRIFLILLSCFIFILT